MPAIKGAMYINIYSIYQPALIKLDNENIGGHRYTFINRKQQVRTTTSSSVLSAVLFGVPQGLVLGPILFLLYTADLLQLVKRHHPRPHAYAADTQIYGHCQPSDAGSLIQQTIVLIEHIY